jgi:hypothetical protein
MSKKEMRKRKGQKKSLKRQRLRIFPKFYDNPKNLENLKNDKYLSKNKAKARRGSTFIYPQHSGSGGRRITSLMPPWAT